MKTLYELSALCDNHNVEVFISRTLYVSLPKKWTCSLKWLASDGTKVEVKEDAASHEGAFDGAWTKLEKIISGQLKNEFMPAIEHRSSAERLTAGTATPLSLDDEIPF